MKLKAVLAVCLLSLYGCSSDDDPQIEIDTGNGNNVNNENNGSDGGTEEDIPTFGDVNANNQNNLNNGCDGASQLEAAWPLHNRVSIGDVTITAAGNAQTATIDASAGGLQQAANNPFIYLDLDGAAKVEISDSDAIRTDTTWEVAFRRTSTFVNGGTYPGDVEVARLTGTTFDAVNAASVPADAAFVTEAPLDADCNVIAPISGFGTVVSVFEELNPDTTSGSWYNYSMGGPSPVIPYADHVYIIRSTDQQKTFKFAFEDWASGVYSVRWEEIP